MTNDARQKLIEAYSAISRGDMEPLLSMLAEDIAWTYAAPPDQLAYGGIHHGVASVRRFFETVGSLVAFDGYSHDQFIAGGSTVVVIGREQGRSIKSGTTYDTPMAHIYDFNSQGQVTAFTELVDSASVVRAIGDNSQ
ncbi:MAG: nuclear transport factor 2 family protein [Pyrinomonadaceae bacterium]|nr:nuclear transport factor 2 family protein [Pyrinomonadaceae bacterium]